MTKLENGITAGEYRNTINGNFDELEKTIEEMNVFIDDEVQKLDKFTANIHGNVTDLHEESLSQKNSIKDIINTVNSLMEVVQDLQDARSMESDEILEQLYAEKLPSIDVDDDLPKPFWNKLAFWK